MKNGKLQMGLVGLGAINQAHLAGYQKDGSHVQIAAVCDVNREVASELGKSLDAAVYADYREMLATADIDAVDVTLPHNLHYPVVRDSLLSKKHVLVEKPMAASTEQCAELIELAAQKGRSFTVAENTPFVAAYRRVENILESGAIGAVRSVRTFIYGSEVDRLTNTTLWKGKLVGSNGGAIIDAGPHSVYLIKWLFGEVTELQATQYKLVEESEVEDNACVSGRLKNGTLFCCEFCFTAEIPWGERLEIYGSKGSIIVDQLVDPPVRLFRHKDDYESVILDDVAYNPRQWKFESIGLGVMDFASAVIDSRRTRVDPEDAMYGIYIAERAYESIEAGGKTVHVG